MVMYRFVFCGVAVMCLMTVTFASCSNGNFSNTCLDCVSMQDCGWCHQTNECLNVSTSECTYTSKDKTGTFTREGDIYLTSSECDNHVSFIQALSTAAVAVIVIGIVLVCGCSSCVCCKMKK